MIRTCRLLLAVFALLACVPLSVHAQAEAKQYFDAGAAAYSAGDYQAAIQAFDAAYRVSPLPAIAFSLAQAERRQYFVSHEAEHLLRAIDLFRSYLAQVATGGRRADATDALAQLEPLALALQRDAATLATAAPAAEAKTRLMVRCEAPHARIALDGAPPAPAPLIVETTAGTHRVAIEAPGFFSEERQVTAVASELVPIEVILRDRPATLLLRERDGADLYVDGVLASPASSPRDRVELPAGRHFIAFAKRGHRADTRVYRLVRGETRVLRPVLTWTGQRVGAVSLLAVGSGTTVASLMLIGLALERQADARKLNERRRSETLAPNELHEYHDALETRGRLRIAAVGGLIASAACLLTGALLFQLDDTTPQDVAPRRMPIALSIVPQQRSIALDAQLVLSF
jgi:hypothetical protein